MSINQINGMVKKANTINVVSGTKSYGMTGMAHTRLFSTLYIIRYAPSFCQAHDAQVPGNRPYTAQTVGQFLGWLKADGGLQTKF
jgi:hypothetical protein